MGQNVVRCPPLAAREAGTCLAAMLPEREDEHWEATSHLSLNDDCIQSPPIEASGAYTPTLTVLPVLFLKNFSSLLL